MNDDLKRNWKEQKDRLKKRFAMLTETDLLFEDGEKGKMLEKLQRKLGKTREELRKIITGP